MGIFPWGIFLCYIKEQMATLAQKSPQKNPQKYICNLCDYVTCNKKDYGKHLLTNKHKNRENPNFAGEMHENASENPQKNPQKNPNVYHCKICNIIIKSKKDYTCHLSTNKHKKNILSSGNNENIVIEIKQPKSYNCEYCNYTAKVLSMYTRHCNSIKHKKNVENAETTTNPDTNETTTTNSTPPNNIVIDKEVFLQLVQDNQEFKRMLIEQNEKLLGLSQNITNNNTLNNNNNNNNNTVNQKFNLNLYLNETCKNAMNWSDFINGIQISQDDLLYNGPLGFPNAMSNVILTNLNQLETTERPIHCTDLKRKSIYIKDKNTWELQKNHDKFYKAVDRISDKFKDTYMDSQEDSDMSTEQEDALMISCRNIMMTGEHIETIPKIVNTVIKEVVVVKH